MVPDYYAMLGIDPGFDREAIAAALARCQPEWSSGTRNPKNKHKFQSYLDQIPAIRQALLGTTESRAAYDAELAAARRAERDRRLDALHQLVRLRAAKGGLTPSDRVLLRDEAFKLGLAASDFERLADPHPLMAEPQSNGARVAPEPPADVLDPVMRRQLRVALDHLRKRDLYDALGLTRDAPAREVLLRADAERQRWMRKTQVTAEKTAWLEVVALAQSHLATPPARARYDRTLALDAEELLRGSVEFALKGLPRIDAGTRLALLDEAARLGVAPDRAEVLIARVCEALGVSRDAAPPGAFAALNSPPRLLRCRSCGGISGFGLVARAARRAECRHCGAPLNWSCPVCQRSHWVDEPRCGCGFPIELREPLVRHFEAAQHAYRTRDYAGAMVHLRRVQEMAPKHVGARKGLERIKQRLAEIDRARSAWEVARGGSRLVEAREALDSWGRLVDPSSPDRRAALEEVTRKLHDAEVLTARARSLARTDPKAARELYRKALAIASDLPEACNGLRECPPDPPSALSAYYVDGRVRLRWSPPPPDGLGPVSYVILRKPETAFTHPLDGLRIGESAGPEYLDQAVVPGTSVAYAVLSRRDGVDSVAAVAVGPIFLLGEVRDVRIETRSREIDLAWTPPPGALEVRVVRKRGSPPGSPLEGDRIDATLDQAHDRGLEPDRVYHYGIFAVYRTPDGRATASHGVFVSAQPLTPVPPLDAPSIALDPDGRVKLHWAEPARGIVKVVRTAGPFPHSAGSRLAPAQVAALDGEWVEVTAPDEGRDNLPPLALAHYTPLTAWGGTSTVGHSAVYSRVADPSDLRATRAGNGQIHLRWCWSPQRSQTVIVARQGAPPTGPEDPAALVETVHESEYSRKNRYTLKLPSGDGSAWHIAVYALSTVDGQPLTSPGSEPSARTVVSGSGSEVVLSYSLRRKRLGRRWSVALHTDPPGASVPATVLVTHPRTVPLSADDGMIVASFPASQDGATFPVPPGVRLIRGQARIFADPRVDPAGLPPIRLRHPEVDATRV